MIQKKFLCKNLTDAKDAIRKMDIILRDDNYSSALLTFYEKGFTSQDITSLLDEIKGCDHSKLKVAGISATLIAELMPEGTGILFNLILSDHAVMDVVSVPCVPGGEAEAAGKLRAKLDSYDSVKAVELFGSNMALNNTLFMERAMEGHEDAVLFGTTTIRNLTQKISSMEDGEVVIEEQAESDIEKDEFIAGDDILCDGFVAVIFAGDNLKVKANYALGWNPIGRKLPIELGDKALKGETVVTSINGMPAVDIYKEYLGVYPDSYFISNICEFPLVVEREGINICLIPIESGRNGELYFMMTLREDEKLRFTFASHDEVLNASRESLESMERFHPEALFLTLCGNRISYLKEDAHIEWDTFSKVCPDHALMHGACELYYHNKQGGILNSAHLAIGMRESEELKASSGYEHASVESLRRGRALPLSDRMSVFLSRITTELIGMAVEARDANKAKSVFLSHMSHEIRTPINAILGMDEMILRESKEISTMEYADSIKSAGNNLLGIVNDILDFSKIEAGKMSIVPVEYELRSLINDMYNVVRLRAEDKGLTVKVDVDQDIPSRLFGDEMRLKQVISNLLTNAVKYTECGSVTFSIKRAEEISEKDKEGLIKACPDVKLPEESIKLMISVKDTGIGIRPQDIEKLFDEYERFDENRNRMIEGTGLGLSITKELLNLMGSRLNVDSVYGEGSEFGFEIMQGIACDECIGDFKGRLNKTECRKMRIGFTAEDAHILVVDDSAVNLTIVKKLLEKTQIQIDTAKSGEEALRLVREHEYDVIFLDHMMPGMDGPTTLKKMKETEGNISRDAAVISLTANASSTAREDYIKDGFKDYLSKPIRPEELEAILFYHIPPEKIRTVNTDS